MKKILFLIILLSTSLLFSQEKNQNALHWSTDFTAAKKQAKAENKPILIVFTELNRCELCSMFDTDFLKAKKFKKIAKDKLILYKAYFPRKKGLISSKQKQINIQLDSTYSKTRTKRAFPTIIFVNSSGEELGFLESYNYIHDTSKHFRLLEAILEKY